MSDDANQEFKILVTSEADTTGFEKTDDAAKSLKETADESSESMESVPENLKNIGTAAADTGEKVSTSREQHMALHHAMSELNRIAPGLGTSVHFLAEGFLKAGEAADESAAATAAFGATLETVMAEILPLLAIVLTIQAATALWEEHKKKVEEVAKAQEDACNSMAESTQKAIDAVKALDDALHPNKTVAQKDEDELAKKLEALKQQREQQKQFDKANEGLELSEATSEAEKAAIREKYQKRDQREEGIYNEQRGYIQGDAAKNAQDQIKAIDADIQQRKDNLEEGNRRARINAAGGTGEEKAHIEEIIAGREKTFSEYADSQRKKAGDLGSTADRFQSEATDTSQSALNQRRTDYQVGQTQAITDKLAIPLQSMHETLGQALHQTGFTIAQTAKIAEGLLDGQIAQQRVLDEIQSRLDLHTKQLRHVVFFNK
jgi:hypothetical protein